MNDNTVDTVDILHIVASNGYRKEIQSTVFLSTVTYHDERLLTCYNRYGYGLLVRTLFQATLYSYPSDPHHGDQRCQEYLRCGYHPDDTFCDLQFSPLAYAVCHGYYRVVALIQDYYYYHSSCQNWHSHHRSTTTQKSTSSSGPTGSTTNESMSSCLYLSSAYHSSSKDTGSGKSTAPLPLPYSSLHDIYLEYIVPVDLYTSPETTLESFLGLGTIKHTQDVEYRKTIVGLKPDHILTMQQLLYRCPLPNSIPTLPSTGSTTKGTFSSSSSASLSNVDRVHSPLWDTDIPRTWYYFPYILGFLSTPAELESIVGKNYHPNHSFLAEVAGYAGNLPMLQYCKDQGIFISPAVSYYAAYNNQYTVLRWLQKDYDKDLLDEWTLAYAALGGHLALVKELYRPIDSTTWEPCPLDCDAISWAAYGGYIDIVRYLHEETDSDWEEMTGYGAVASGNIALLEYLFLQCNPPCPSHEYTYIAAIRHHQLAVVRWLHEHNYAWNKCTVLACIQYGCLPVLQYLYDHDKDLFDDIEDVLYPEIIRQGSVDTLLWFRSHFPISVNSLRAIVDSVSILTADRQSAMLDYVVSQDLLSIDAWEPRESWHYFSRDKPIVKFLRKLDCCEYFFGQYSNKGKDILIELACRFGYLRFLGTNDLATLPLYLLKILLSESVNNLEKLKHIYKYGPQVTTGAIETTVSRKWFKTVICEGYLPVLKYLVEVFKIPLFSDDKQTYYAYAIKAETRDILEYLLDYFHESKLDIPRFQFGTTAPFFCIRNGNIHFFKYLIEVHGVSFDPSFLDQVCEAGHLILLKWLVTSFPEQYPITHRCFKQAALGGHLHILKYLVSKNAALLDDKVLGQAIYCSHINIAKYVRSLRPDGHCDPSEVDECAASNSLAVLRWCREQNFPWTSNVTRYAVGNDSIVMLRWLRSQNAPEDTDTCYETRSTRMDKYFKEFGCLCCGYHSCSTVCSEVWP